MTAFIFGRGRKGNIPTSNVWLPAEFQTSRAEVQREYRHAPDPHEPHELHMSYERDAVFRHKQRAIMDRRWS